MDSAMSRSDLGIKRLPDSNKVTLLPKPAYMVANSIPMVPAPRMSRCLGSTLCRSSVSLVKACLLSFSPSTSGRMGVEPVLMKISFP